MIIPVILSGGSGTRLWPLSRELYPKQLLPLVSEKTMLQETVRRITGIADIAGPLVIANESHRFMIVEQMRLMQVKPSAIVLEPVGRNTAPAVAVAALRAIKMKKDPVLLVLPADHVIENTVAFLAAVHTGRIHAEAGKLITFGIVPGSPATGYGYIRKGRALKIKGDVRNKASRLTAFTVARFEEKPDLAKAKSFVQSGDYLWNSGMFMFKASVYLKELKRHAPEILKACEKADKGATKDLDFLRLDEKAFTECPADSIDYAVMEKTGSAVVIPLDAGWSDVGSWSSLWEVLPRDDNGNAVSGDVILRDVKDSFIHAGGRLVAAVGIKDLVIVETADAVLVSHKNKVQKVKQIVAHLKSDNRCEANLHRRVNRPWGAYECINREERFQVKRITVNPGASSSLQVHQHRAEHWIVVKGTARITKGKEVLTLSENESTYIPLGTRHRLENPGKIPLELIEVQSGSYLGEDDIERFDDRYGRKGSNK
ncbi:MAG: mannose-1-phosphate guanylyltransferase/mannose-6-phosphate isomerase [Nitrospirae bacterium]|nr:mannose-1-phosphate guanylyltransferase/mannose-6-phosphate isomerase [Nitrospirota bacterium]